ncbi:Peroxisome biosynthesis protein pex1 [Apophysomyces sp. BC1034]|nr:Peroxisome biosynthesis protein pex1 [Apophysomyces sp. BC1015]KAG0187177.1 Peroxisome biosynthesis protein pex1 [Apophysomyces sp. BC1034]
MPKPLIVQFTPIRSCLINLPAQWVNALLDQRKVPQNVVLEIGWSTKQNGETKKAYFGWSGEASKALPPNSVFTHGPNSKLDVLEMDPQLGMAIGLTEGEKVNVEFCRNVSDCTSVHVEPYAEDDWEILELHAGYVEENLLSQLRVVYSNQLMCVWVHGRTLVRLKVVELNPSNGFVKLTTNSEVIVAPKVRKSTKPADIAAAHNLSVKQQKLAPHVCLRSVPDVVIDPSHKDRASVLLHPDSAGELAGQSVVRVSKIIPGFTRREANDEKEPVANVEEVAQAKAIYAPLVLSTDVPKRHVYIEKSIRHTLEIKDYDMIKLSVVTAKKNTPGSIVFRPFTTPTQHSNTSLKLGLDSSAQSQAQQQKAERDNGLTHALRTWLTATTTDQIILTQGTVISLTTGEEEIQGMIQFGQKKGMFSSLTNAPATSETATEQYIVLAPSQVKGIQIEIGEEIPKEETKTKKKSTSAQPVLGGVQKVFEKVHQYTVANLAERGLKDFLAVPGTGGILITGAHGAGKTSLVKKLMQSVHNDRGALTYTLEINCAEIAEERVPTLKDTFQRWFDEAAWHAPSLIFLDDIDRLIPAEVEHADSTRSRHLAELFTRQAMTMTKRHSIMVIATSQQQQSVHPSLITNHMFSELRHLNPPSRDERKEIMHAIMSHGSAVLVKSVPNIDLVSVASETEGYLAADLKALIERAVHEGAIRSIKTEAATEAQNRNGCSLDLLQQDFTNAREGFVPSSLRGIKLQSSGVNWSDIGGLNETRKALLETLEWPTKYAAVFSQCPLRLRSGLLLYGYPGCGKTLLASAVAKECGLNFISVKGPEILNKYIGASEKSVRDLFERAQAAKPCVLFFDEFDSIAPRRGHDSTGVTDRVVNQMLTQMDGAEGLDGVYVLAATSRPDLIDPALLRPGRLDKALLCGMPSFEERLEILEALSRKMTLAPGIELREFAGKTEGYSGADLQGFLYNSHLEAIHGSINIDSFREQQKKEKDDPVQEKAQNDFVFVGQKAQAKTLTLAEKGQISQRLAMIKKGILGQDKRNNEQTAEDAVQPSGEHLAEITRSHLEKSLKGTRPSITAEECLRLQMIYDEFVTGRTGQLPSGEGAKGIGKRTTLG